MGIAALVLLLAGRTATAYDIVTTTVADQATALSTCEAAASQYPPHLYFGVPNQTCKQLFNVVGERNGRYDFCTAAFPPAGELQTVLCDSGAQTKYEFKFPIPYEGSIQLKGAYPSNAASRPPCLAALSAAQGFPAADCRYDSLGLGYSWSTYLLFNNPSQTEPALAADSCAHLYSSHLDLTFCEEHYYDTQICEWGSFANAAGYNQCYPQERNAARACEARPLGNPINPAAGNKYQQEIDASAASGALGIVRHYNSRVSLTRPSPLAIGQQWTLDYDRRVESPDSQGGDTVTLFRPDGRVELFDAQGGGAYQTTGDNHATLSATLDGGGVVTAWHYTGADNRVEDYDANGKLLSITDLAGNTQTLSYDSNGRLDRVDANTGEYLQFGYDTSDRIATISDSASRIWTYHYDTVGNLASVDNPDGTTWQYHYNESIHTSGADLPHALTGITDERGNRYATFEYQADGRAVASLHAGDAQRVDIGYNDANGTRTVTDSLGHTSTYSTAVQLGVALVTGIEGPGCSSCGGSNTTYSYDPANNNLLSKTANGVETQYGDYDAQGQKGYQIEAVGTTNERRTDYSYDSRFHGKVTTVTEASVYQP